MSTLYSHVLLSLLLMCANAEAQSEITLHPPLSQPDSTQVVDRHTLPDEIALEALVVEGSRKRNIQMKTAQNIVRIQKSYIEENFSGSLMQTLDKIPGIKAMTIGSSQSKPAIRGLGFNRMTVTENGIKHEGQQWGEDHGLEIDQFSVDEIEIIKGPGSLLHGSDAIGGVIQLRNRYIPTQKVEGNINLYGKSNNASTSISGQVSGRLNRWYYRVNGTYNDYSDYKVPTDSIQYHSYYIQLNDGRLRNTAGRERNAGATLGYLGDKFRSQLLVSNIHTKSGFFADAHGLEVRLSKIDYDKSIRDISLPYHSVNHFKMINNSVLRHRNITWETYLAFQRNLREEYSEPVSHGYMPIPPSALERQFNKHTYSANTVVKMPIKEQVSLQAGLSADHQRNKRGGWGFVLPAFRSTSLGAFVYARYHLSHNLILSAGGRGDRIQMNIDSYRDWFQTPDANGTPTYMERAADLEREFNSFTWSTGINFHQGKWAMKANIGKSFRAPTPKELGSDGINYHIFRYEKGDSHLKAEESYQLDLGVSWHNHLLSLSLEPYFNYFPNYIYLNPTPAYKEGLQLYHYAQAEVVRAGLEADVALQISRSLSVGMQAEYLYAEQLSGHKKGYPLPFSPPWSSQFHVEYSPGKGLLGADGDLRMEYSLTGAQDRIVPPEEKTAGYQLLHLSMGRSWEVNDSQLKLRLRAENILNKRYYDHTGFYRLIGAPEPGRNFSVMVGIQF